MTDKEREFEVNQLLKVNDSIKTIDIKNKVKTNNGYEWVTTPYATVSARVMGFRLLYPTGTIETNLTYDEKYVYAEARISDCDLLLSTGHAREYKENKFAPEVAESSAVGRALGLLGIGIQNGIASAEDMEKKNETELFDIPIENKDEWVRKFTALYTLEEQVKILNMKQITKVEDMELDSLKKYVENRQKKQTN
jgi:hypothetical protein